MPEQSIASYDLSQLPETGNGQLRVSVSTRLLFLENDEACTYDEQELCLRERSPSNRPKIASTGRTQSDVASVPEAHGFNYGITGEYNLWNCGISRKDTHLRVMMDRLLCLSFVPPGVGRSLKDVALCDPAGRVELPCLYSVAVNI